MDGEPLGAAPPGPEASRLAGLGEALAHLVPALERFLRFQDPLPAAGPVGWEAALAESLPEEGAGLEAVLDLLCRVVIPGGLPTGAPGFCGWVTTAPTLAPAVAALAAALAGPQRRWVTAFNFLEALSLDWLRQLFGLPPDFQGIYVSGGAVANLVGLAAARQWAGERRGVDPARDGAALLPAPRIYASAEVHHVVHRAAAILGLGREAVVALPTGPDLTLDVAALRDCLRADRARGCTPVAVVASAGTVATGAVDPLAAVAAVCQEEGVWLHVDGSYGLPGMLDPAVAHLFRGLEAAHSIAVDPHKWLAVPVGCGAAFVRDAGVLRRTFALPGATYLHTAGGPDPGRTPVHDPGPGPTPTPDVTLVSYPAPPPGGIGFSPFHGLGYPFLEYGPELSAPSRGVLVWAVLKEIGAAGLRERVRRHNAFARHLAALVEASPVLELLAPVTLSICCFRYVPPALRGRVGAEPLLDRLNRAVLARVQARGRAVPSGTLVRGHFAIRACFINPRTTLADVEALAEEVERCGAVVWRSMAGDGGAGV